MSRYVDPKFGAELRRLREERGMSLRDLYATSHISKSLISEYENGKRRPSADAAGHLDRALNAAGALAALVVETDTSTADLERADQIAYAQRMPRILDAGAVDALADMLAAHRRLDDTMPAAILWPTASAHHEMLSALAREARGPQAEALGVVHAESLQFSGWLRAQLGQHAEADRLYAASAERAEELGAGGLASQSRRFRGSLAWERGRPAAMVRFYQHAAHTPNAPILHRIDAELRTAHGLALLGHHDAAVRALHQADDMTNSAAAQSAEPDQFGYWLTPSWLRFPLGLAHLELGRPEDAAENLRAGLDGLPVDQRETNWTTQYREALDTAEDAA
ncbi:helix-turn-helix domain-containing protein [Promicromonospora sukumoe]|uniref:helix-turn-helix domain-containing protein n=1 Tax=Promicromonospora sukumoe TaxID=88382 RepID=UPI0037CBCC6A